MPIPSPGTIANRLSIVPPLAAGTIAPAPPAPQEQEEQGDREADQVGDDVPGAGVPAGNERLMVFVGDAPEKHEEERPRRRPRPRPGETTVKGTERQERDDGVTARVQELVPEVLGAGNAREGREIENAGEGGDERPPSHEETLGHRGNGYIR